MRTGAALETLGGATCRLACPRDGRRIYGSHYRGRDDSGSDQSRSCRRSYSTLHSADSFGGSLWCIRFGGPIRRFGQNPTLRGLLTWKISNVGIGTVTRGYRNKPSAVLVHFRLKSRLLAHGSICAPTGPFSSPELCHNQTDPLPRAANGYILPKNMHNRSWQKQK
jgi:hypothetical protein